MDLWIIQKGSVWYTKNYNFDDIKIGPKIGPKIRPKIGPKIGPEIGPKIQPKIGPEIGPKIEPEIVPEIVPEIGPKIQPKIQPEIGPEIGPKIGRPSLDMESLGWWQNLDVGDWNIILMTSNTCHHSVNNLRHQHRCFHFSISHKNWVKNFGNF